MSETGYQLRHKEWGVFQGEFLGLGFWHPMSDQPEQGFCRFETRNQAEEYRNFLCRGGVDGCQSKHSADEFTIELFDVAMSRRMQSEGFALVLELTKALEDLGNWLAFGLEKPDGEEVAAEDLQRCQEVAEQAGAAVAKGHRFLGDLGSCTFPSQVAAALVIERAKLEERQERHSDAFYGTRQGDSQC